jgi:mannose-6-phosphate isomerase-like protein (cupin superfamily)
MNFEKVHEDKRGEIYAITGEDELSNLLVTHKGFARGGCMHKETEHFLVVQGQIILHLPYKDQIMNAGECVSYPPMTPHFFISLTESIVMESGAQPPADKYLPYAEKVAEINSSN